MMTDLAITPAEHLTDLRRDLADWLRAHAGWPEDALREACGRTADALRGEPLVGATAAVQGAGVHLHFDNGRDLDLVAHTAF
jgi:hypothetical protein